MSSCILLYRMLICAVYSTFLTIYPALAVLPWVGLDLSPTSLLLLIFYKVRSVLHPIWRTWVWVITFDLSGMGGPTSSYATTSVAVRVISPHIKIGIPSVGLLMIKNWIVLY